MAAFLLILMFIFCFQMSIDFSAELKHLKVAHEAVTAKLAYMEQQIKIKVFHFALIIYIFSFSQ